MAFIALRDPGTDAVVFRQWPGTRYDEYRSLRIAPGQGAGGQVLATGRPFRTDCYLEDARIGSEFTAVAREEAMRAYMAVPIKTDERVEGFLPVANRDDPALTHPAELNFVPVPGHAPLPVHNPPPFAEQP